MPSVAANALMSVAPQVQLARVKRPSTVVGDVLSSVFELSTSAVRSEASPATSFASEGGLRNIAVETMTRKKQELHQHALALS